VTIFRVPINITFPGAGSPGVNVWHMRTVFDGGPTELAQANVLLGYLRTFYQGVVGDIPIGTTLSLGTVTDVATQREIVPSFLSVAGLGTGSAPQALCICVTWRTEVAARRGRGRTFIGPLDTSAMQSDGTIRDNLVASTKTAAAALVTSSQIATNGAFGVWGYRDAKPAGQTRDPASPRIFRDFTGSSVRDIFGLRSSRRD
jgi:hypothetical protein